MYKPTNDLRGLMIACGLCLLIPLAQEGSARQKPDSESEVISADFPYGSKFVEVNGARMHYVDVGEGQVFLFLHGNPTSSYLWRNVMPFVQPVGRTIAVDNIGFGKSDKPELDYTFQTHRDYIDGFIEVLGLENLIIVGHDWGSVLGLDHARRNPGNVKGVVFMEAIIPPAYPRASLAEMGDSAAMFRAFRDPETGREMLIEDNMFVEEVLPGAVLRSLTEEEMAAYRAPFEDKAARFPIYVWPNELPIEGEPRRNVEVIEKIGAWLETSEVPKLLLYARPGAIVSPDEAQWMVENYNNLQAQFVGYGIHFIQEDEPEAIGRAISDWYRRTF
jgi:haloalkane dehalogenase